MKLQWNSPLNYLKIHHSDWFNKRLNDQQLSMIFRADRRVERRREEKSGEVEKAGHVGADVTSQMAECKLTEMG